MKTIRKTKIKKALKELALAIRGAEMEGAYFDGNNPGGRVVKQEHTTVFVKEITKLYVKSWIKSPINRAIGVLEKELSRE